ncbi:response regulator transcription factor [Autumnicola psychrophila]|uniref:Response regulator n=1 Tax=Autumnicola psychrophila TaxID=3075592 RepID=A0ABU3DTZ8_9FLAO|nr:response regulator [Zunongwangia sp. F225]MDT0687188.1 response regulator [Zunongwangia sp. F225]
MKQIFIVEDDDDIRELLEYLLMSREYKVQSFATAEGFKSYLPQEDPDLILLDIMLPDGNGLDICRDLTLSSNKNHIPVFLMSAHENPSRNKEVGAVDFISKPFDLNDLCSRISKQLES